MAADKVYQKPKARDFRREARTYKSALQQIVTEIDAVVRFIDDEMKKPSTQERGKRIARATNALEMAKDQARLTLGTLKIHGKKSVASSPASPEA